MRNTLLLLLIAAIAPVALSAQEGTYREAPMLAERVASGELPPVDERLPDDPFVLTQDNPAWNGVGGFQAGQYGGTVEMGITWQTYHKMNWYARRRGYEGFDEILGRNQIVRYEPASGTIEPGLVASWELSDEDRTLTLHLRKGLKWSDGEPLTADDFVFTYDHIFRNEALGRDPAGWSIGGEPVEMHAIDDTTLRLTNPNPLTGFIITLRGWFLMPEHLAAPYTPGVTEGATEDDFNTKIGNIGDLAVHGPWLPIQEQEGLVVVERNPYYWKVDYEGQQLPYIDRIILHTYEDVEVIGLELAAGNLDFAARRIPSDLGVLMANRDRGNYDVHLRLNDAPPYLWFHVDVEDDNLRELFRNKNFRQAMQYAVNQEQMGNVLFPGAWSRTWPSLIEQSPYFDESVAQRYDYYSFDLDKAGRLLDEAGYRDTTEDGKRNFSDGSPIEFVVDMPKELNVHINAMEMYREDLEQLGITMFVRPVEGSVMWERHNAGETQAFYPFWLNVGGDPVLMQPHALFPKPYDHRAGHHAVGRLPREEAEKWEAEGVKFVPGRFPPEMEEMGELAFQIVPLPLDAAEERARLYGRLQALMWEYPLWIALPPADKAPLAMSKDLTNLVNVGNIGITANQHDIYVEYLWYK